ncbi:MAG: hypothetical protein HRT58_07640 [Crocinitomicaceae bacterium]|nr:hypothetical protein [Flavobacteriales bacterium]NQZ35522.1 hypothetical protein [Crocinitomicaceae bacterium]
MLTNRNKLILSYALIAAIILCSFFYYSSNFHIQFDSDDGVVVLMLHSFHLPDDFYFWKQDRVGSITPFIGQLFFKGIGLSAILSESIAHYLVLVGGFFGFAILFKNHFSKIAFALIWFFPILHMTGVVRYTFGLQYAFLGMAIGLMVLYQKRQDLSQWIQYVYLFLISLALFCALWACDAAVLSIPALLLIIFFHYKSQTKLTFIKLLKRKEIIIALVIGMVGLAYIVYMKSIADKPDDLYNVQLFNTFNELILTLQTIGETLWSFLTFQAVDFLESIYFWGIIGIFILLIYQLRQRKNSSGSEVSNPWIRFFLIDALLLFLAIIIFHWALQNDVSRRYFCGIYISLWMAFLLFLESKKVRSRIIQFSLLAIILVGSYSTHYGYANHFPKSTISKKELLKDFKTLGNIGVIADYWNSYVLSATAPDQIIATPYAGSASVRKLDVAESVFHQDNIYVIRDGWIEEFPDTLEQFGHVLIKSGNSFNMGNCFVCRYIDK